MTIALVVACIAGVIVEAFSRNLSAALWATAALIGALGRLV